MSCEIHINLLQPNKNEQRELRARGATLCELCNVMEFRRGSAHLELRKKIRRYVSDLLGRPSEESQPTEAIAAKK